MNIDTKPRNRIKKIFLDGIMHLGDVITAASVIPVLKEQYPHSEIHYLVKDSVALPASLICGVDRVIPYTYQSGGGALDVIRMGKKLSQEGYDLGISLDPRERVTLMKWIARIPLRLSMERALGWELGWESGFIPRTFLIERLGIIKITAWEKAISVSCGIILVMNHRNSFLLPLSHQPQRILPPLMPCLLDVLPRDQRCFFAWRRPQRQRTGGLKNSPPLLTGSSRAMMRPSS